MFALLFLAGPGGAGSNSGSGGSIDLTPPAVSLRWLVDFGMEIYRWCIGLWNFLVSEPADLTLPFFSLTTWEFTYVTFYNPFPSFLSMILSFSGIGITTFLLFRVVRYFIP